MPHAIKQIIPFSQLSAHPGKQNNNALVTAVYRSQSQSRSCRNPREEENERRAVTATTPTDGPGRTEKLRCVRWTQWGGDELSSPRKIILYTNPPSSSPRWPGRTHSQSRGPGASTELVASIVTVTKVLFLELITLPQTNLI